MSDARITLSAVDKTGAAFSSARQRMAGLAGEAEGLSSRFVALGATVGSALLAKGFFDGLVAGVDRLNDLKDATGASIGNISALEDIAARAGTQFEVVSTSLTKLNQALLTAKPGDDVTAALEAIGLQAEELRRIDPAEALLQVAKGLDQFADDGSKARVQLQLFGRSSREVSTLLKDVAEAGALNSKSTEEQTAAAEKYVKVQGANQKALQDLGRSVVAAVLPAINALSEAIHTADEETGKFSLSAEVAKRVTESLVVGGANVVFVFKGVGREIGAVAAQIAALGRGDFEGFRAISEAVKADGERARAELEKFERRVMQLGRPANEGGGRLLSNGPRPSLGDVKGKPSNLAVQISEFDKYAQQLARTLVTEKELGQEQQTRLDIAAGKLGKLNLAQADYLTGLAKAIDERARADRAEEEAKRKAERDKGAIQSLVDSSTGARFDALITLTDRVTEAFNRGELSVIDFQRAAESLGKGFEALEPKIEKLSETVNTFAEQAARNIQDALGESVLQGLEGNFKSIERLWGDTIKRLLAQAAAAQLNTALFGDTFGQKGGQLGGLVGGALDWFGGPKAMGGPVQPGKAYLVGERRPELFVPNTAGTIVPSLEGLSQRGGGNTVVVNVNGPVPQETVALIRDEVGRALNRFQRNASVRGAA